MKLWYLIYAIGSHEQASTLLEHSFNSLPDCLVYEAAMEPVTLDVEWSSCELIDDQALSFNFVERSILNDD